jgi:predicted metal-dependent hydrolase
MEGLFERGIEEFNTRYFFEAHDTWEELWMETTGSHRLFYQGLIQTAVGFYHLGNDNYKGACSQLGKALAKLEQYLPAYHGIAVQPLVERLHECLRDAEALRGGGADRFDERKIPQIVHEE